MPLLDVASEIGTLRTVLVHEPGHEWDLVPGSSKLAQQYLIEDLFVLREAQREHETFTHVLKAFIGDDNVLEFADLLTKVCEDPDGREKAVAAVVAFELLGDKVSELLLDSALAAADLATALICGALVSSSTPKKDYSNLFAPVPNLLFTRDLGAAISGAFVPGFPALTARRREALLTRLVLHESGLFDGKPIIDIRDLANDAFWAEMLAARADAPSQRAFIEGGDILVLSNTTLMIGTGERTTTAGLFHLIEAFVEDKRLNPPERIIRAVLPESRSSMHLDTVMTMLDRNQFIIYDPIVRDMEFYVYETPYETDFIKTMAPKTLKQALETAGFASPELVKCGGPNELSQTREQWTDGANLLAIAPGIVMGYDRNTETARTLMDDHRYTYLHADHNRDALEETAVTFQAGKLEKRVLIGLPGAELSRARGGPRCMTLPLERERTTQQPS